jgi:hypothetical protein
MADTVKDPLAVDKALVKEFKIPKEIELHPRQKLAFLEAQLHELKSAQWRARVDVIHASRLQESPVEALKNKGLQNIGEHKNQVQQFTGGIVMIQNLIEQVRKEYPELKEVKTEELEVN